MPAMYSWESVSGLGLVALAVGLLAAYLLTSFVYSLYFHPLARVPGPRLWAGTRLAYAQSLVRGRLTRDVAAMHRRYGPVVRVAPDELAFASPAAWPDVLAPRLRPDGGTNPPFWRHPRWWKRPQRLEAFGRVDAMVNAPTPTEHRRQRRLLAPAFTERAMAEQEPIVQRYVGSLVEHLRQKIAAAGSGGEEKGWGVVVDIKDWFAYTTFDIFGDLAFGESFDCLENSQYHPWIATLFENIRAATLMSATQLFPPFGGLLEWCLPPAVVSQANQHFRQIADRVDRRLSKEVHRPDFMSHLMALRRDGKPSLTRDEMHANLSIFTGAGSETTATALAGIASHLVAHPATLRRLVEEVRAAFAREDDVTLAAAQPLPYLSAVINEGLRLCPPVPVIMPRIAPEGGGSVAGVWVPERTAISLYAFSLGRDQTRIHEPDTWRPERWLPEARALDSPYRHDQLESLMPFSFGQTVCIGRPLAWAELRLILARLLWNFDMEAAGAPLRWEDQKVFLVWEKQPVKVRLRERQHS